MQVANTSITLPSDHTYSNFTANLNLQLTLLQDSINAVDCKLDQYNFEKQDNKETRKAEVSILSQIQKWICFYRFPTVEIKTVNPTYRMETS